MEAARSAQRAGSDPAAVLVLAADFDQGPGVVRHLGVCGVLRCSADGVSVSADQVVSFESGILRNERRVPSSTS